MKTLSKSKLIAYRQCPKRLWLEVHQPELLADSAGTKATFATGHQVGAMAIRLYDTAGLGTELKRQELGTAGLLAKTQELLPQGRPIFEAGFTAVYEGCGVLALADILLPGRGGKSRTWRMVEVKSAAKVKDYQRDDVAIQHYVVTQAGLKLSAVALAYVDSGWTYPGGGDYSGLLKEEDVTAQASARKAEVQSWIKDAHKVVARRKAPAVAMGQQCSEPFACGFSAHCTAQDEAEHGVVAQPVHWLPRVQTKALKAHLANAAVRSMADVPDDLLNVIQLRVKKYSLNGKVFFDAKGAALALAPHKLPALFLDFESINFAVPQWAGTRPYQQVLFQFSLHRVLRSGRAVHSGFLDLSGDDPTLPFAKALIAACDGTGPIFVYNKSFEGGRIEALAGQAPRLAKALRAIKARLVDLLPITQAHYYHPAQQGSWSIKAVLPAVAPELTYSDLEGVQNGGGAQAAFVEATHPDTPAARRQALRTQLWRYCRLDTFAMVRLWQYLSGRKGFVNPVDDSPSLGSAD